MTYKLQDNVCAATNYTITIIFSVVCCIIICIFEYNTLRFIGRYKCTDKKTSEWTKMSLPMLRGCCRVPLRFRLILNESIILSRSGKQRLPSSSPAAAVTAAVRPYSSDRGGQKQNKKKVLVVGIPNPFMWFRTRIYYFLIRSYFDKEFNIEEFTEGAIQVSKHVNTTGDNNMMIFNVLLVLKNTSTHSTNTSTHTTNTSTHRTNTLLQVKLRHW